MKPTRAKALPSDQQPKSAKPKSAQPKPGQAKVAKPTSGETSSGETNSGKSNSGKSKSGTPESGKPKSSKPKSGKQPAPELAQKAATKGKSTDWGEQGESAGRVISLESLGLGSSPPGFRSGFVALIGRPNVGKSTLLNQLVGEKVAITSPVAQTTRNRLRGILTTATAQLVFVDTPGIHKPHHLLGERLVQSARGAIAEVDAVVLLVDGSELAGRGDGFIVELLQTCRVPVHVALNKHDLVPADRAWALEASYRDLVASIVGSGNRGDQPKGSEGNGSGSGKATARPWPLHPISALSGAGTEALLDAIAADLPLGPHLYPADAVSDQPEQLLLAELIREQVLTHTREEIPHSVAVSIDRIVEDGPRTAILATVLVERSSQKAILIGKGGSMLKQIGTGARQQMVKLIDGPVYLELFVKVVPNWRRNPARLAELGYRGD
jgi:GTP-binding protein Era